MAISVFRDNDNTLHVEWYKKATGETFTVNDLVYLSATGFVTKATDASIVPLGLVQRAITSSTFDLDTTNRIPVLVGGPDVEYLVSATTTSASTDDIGEWVDLDGTNNPHQNVDVGTTSNDIFFVTDVISSSQVIAKMAKKSGTAIG